MSEFEFEIKPGEQQRQGMTVGHIAVYVGKSVDWVKPRLAPYADTIFQAPDARKHMRPNYPIEVAEILRKEAQALQDFPVVDVEDISRHGLSLILGREESWIQNRELMLGLTSTQKLQPANNRIFDYFRLSDIPVLRAESERMRAYPTATEDDATIEALADYFNRERGWVERRLRYITLIPTVKRHPVVGQLYAFYPREATIRQIEELPRGIGGVRTGHTPFHPTHSHQLKNTAKEADSENWREFAECAQTDPEIFVELQSPRNVRMARQVCGKCGVRAYCLDFALANNEKSGMWGGLTPNERKSLHLVG